MPLYEGHHFTVECDLCGALDVVVTNSLLAAKNTFRDRGWNLTRHSLTGPPPALCKKCARLVPPTL